MIKDSLMAAGIKRVVWIDDFFAAPSREKLIELIQKTLVKLKECRHLRAPGFEEILLDDSESTIRTKVEEFLEDKSTKDVSVLFNGIKDILNDAEAPADAQDDLSSEEFTKLKATFGKLLVTQSLEQWTSSGASDFSSAEEDTLFLIDKEFTRESPNFDGSTLIADLVASSTAFCILLTHRCSNAEEEGVRRNEISESKGISFHKFAVLSKRSGDPTEPIQRRFARAFSAVMMHRFTGDIAYSIADSIKKSVEDTALKLSKLSVYDLDRAVFVNSSREGVLEFDVLVRIFNSVERGALNKALCAKQLQTRLRRMRIFGKATRGYKVHAPAPDSMREFRQWRQNEVFEAGVALNRMHAPLVCGDVFEIQNQKKDRFILLGQACDLMIRSKNGKRRASLGFLIQVKDVKSDATEESVDDVSVSTFDLEGVFGAADIWRVNFRAKIIADLNVLDLAVFNADGILRLGKEHPEPEITLSDGWERRFSDVKKLFSAEGGKLKKLPLCIGAFSSVLKANLKKGVLTYPLARVGRLEGNTATAILAAWATFETRAALQHDFAAPEKSTVVS